MITKIVVDAGSTSMNWAIIHSDGSISKHQSDGWNASMNVPFPQLPADISHEIKTANELYFYGAGVTSFKKKNQIKEALNKINLSIDILVHSDLMAAARALFGKEYGIVCILGTGSNVAFYNDQKLHFSTPSLGYVLSDEGSGNKIGTAIIKDYFYKTMPEPIRECFKKKYKLQKEELLENLYRRPNANKYLAEFVPFLKDIDDPWKDTLLKSKFEQLIEEKILQHKNFLSVPVGFVGSISQVFRQQLESSCKKYDIHNIQIVANPLDKLIEYHKEN